MTLRIAAQACACVLLTTDAQAAANEAPAGTAASAPADQPIPLITMTAKPVVLPEKFDLKRRDIRKWVADASKRLEVPPAELDTLLGKAVPQSSIVEAMTRPAESVLPWWQYRARFLSATRIDGGVRFWQENRERIEKVAAERGVPPEYLVAILGVETLYGRQKGRYRVLDALATLSFEYDPRAEFFRKEFEQFLAIGHSHLLDPLTATGSYAGAMGMPQFMPSSYRRYAVDANGDGHIDVWNDLDDILASVANFLVEHGWQRGEPVLVDASNDPGVDDPTTRNMTPNQTVGALQARGYQFVTAVDPATPALIVAAEQEDGMGWRVGFRNFQVITRYNRSTRYAMAVHDLAQSLVVRMRPPPLAAVTE